LTAEGGRIIFGHGKAVPIAKSPATPLAAAVLLACSIGLSLYVCVLVPLGSYGIADHGFRIPAPVVVVTAAVFFGLLLAAWKLLLGRAAAGLPGLLPLATLIVSPFLLDSYLTRGDLRTRLLLLAAFVAAAVLYLERARRVSASPPRPGRFERIRAKLDRAPRRARLVLLFLAALLVYNVTAWILTSRDVAFAGDEPTYLLTAHSLLQDGDINLADDYDAREYERFYEMENNPLMRFDLHAHRGRKGPSFAYPINMPGISVTMLPFVWLSGLFRGSASIFILRAGFSIWAALLGVQLYLLAFGMWNDRKTAFRLWAAYAFTAPVLFYSVHLYPELPVAFFSALVYRKLASARPPSVRGAVLCGAVLALFPWFGLKYVALLWPLVAVAGFVLWKERKSGKQFLLLAAFPVLSQALYFAFTYHLYGSFSPISIYEGVAAAGPGPAIRDAYLTYPFRYRIESFLNYFLDQRDGLLLYSPLYFFSFLGIVEAFRKRRRDFYVLLVLLLPYIAVHAGFSQRQGYCPQGRNLAAVSWILILFVGYFLAHNKDGRFAWLYRASVLWSLVTAAILAFHPDYLYQPTTSGFTSRPGDLFVYLSNFRFFLPDLLPSFLKIPNAGYWPNYVWILATLGFVAAYVFLRPRDKASRAFRPAAAFAALAVSIFLWVLYPRSVLYPAYTVNPSSRTALAYYLFPMGAGVIPKPTGVLYLHLAKPYKILFNAKAELKGIKIVFGSEKGEHGVNLELFDRPVFSGTTRFERKEVEVPAPAFVRNGSLYLYEIDVRLVQRSGENMRIDPFSFTIVPSLDP
jgi:hypothetical protein